MTAGRPTDYRDSHCAQVIELGKQGKSHAQIAAALDVSRQTMYTWQEKHPEFLDAITRARDLAQAWFEEKGQIGLADKTFNAALWDKQVSARFRNEYGKHLTVAGDPEAPLMSTTDDQIDARLNALLAKANGAKDE